MNNKTKSFSRLKTVMGQIPLDVVPISSDHILRDELDKMLADLQDYAHNDYDTNFIESMVEKVGRQETLTKRQANRIQQLWDKRQ